MNLRGLHPIQLAERIGNSEQTIQNWLTGKHDPPPYIDLTIEAVIRNLSPLSDDEMYGYQLSEIIGVPKETEWTWRYDRKFPLRARLAVAFIRFRQREKADKLSRYDRSILQRVVEAGAYYRRPNGWRARPTLGKTPQPMQAKTPTNLIVRGYLRVDGDRLTPTSKGRTLCQQDR